jgi:hypothetical protein
MLPLGAQLPRRDRDWLVVGGEMHMPDQGKPTQFLALEDYARKHFEVAEVTHTCSAEQ